MRSIPGLWPVLSSCLVERSALQTFVAQVSSREEKSDPALLAVTSGEGMPSS